MSAAAYNASKAAILSLTKSDAVDVCMSSLSPVIFSTR